MGASSRVAWSGRDKQRAKLTGRFVMLLQLFSLADANFSFASQQLHDDSSSSSSSSSSDFNNCWSDASSARMSFCVQMLATAESPFRRRNLTPRVGPQLWSLQRIEREWGESSLSCATYFRCKSVSDLRRLGRALRVPDQFSVRGYHFTGEEGLLIMLNRFAYPATLGSMCWESGRGTTALSVCFLYMCQHVYDNFAHLRDKRSLLAWRAHFPRFAHAVHMKARQNGRGVGLRNCVGFIDGTVQRVSRPGRYQRILYNGHKKCHSVKWQGIMLPNGIMPMPFGPVNGRRNDGFMVQKSGIEQIMRRANRTLDRTYCLYGDAAYGSSNVLQGPFKESEGPLTPAEEQFNAAMSAMRVPNEWGFGKVKVLFAFVSFSRPLKPLLSPIGYYWPVAQILTNCHTCLYSSQTSQYFGVAAPSLEVYVNMGSNL